MANNYLHQSTDEIEYLKISMYRSNMDSIPTYSLPIGYSLQLYADDNNDKAQWAEIAMAAGEFKSKEDALEMFENSYSKTEEKMPLTESIYFLVNSDGKYIGTSSAVYWECDGKEYAGLGWVSIIPEYQGKKLAKPMVSTVLRKIAEYANECHLDSQTTSWKAINMYADLGFVPVIKTDDSKQAWKLLSKLCQRNFISEID